MRNVPSKTPKGIKIIIVGVFIMIADVMSRIYTYIKGRRKGHKDCATAMSESKNTINDLLKDNAELKKENAQLKKNKEKEKKEKEE